LPFDQFVRQQLAGDLLASERAASQNSDSSLITDSLVATGFLAAARYSGNELDKEIQRNDLLATSRRREIGQPRGSSGLAEPFRADTFLRANTARLGELHRIC
jgi:hypothetical protein